jgi:hypothetical protein
VKYRVTGEYQYLYRIRDVFRLSESCIRVIGDFHYCARASGTPGIIARPAVGTIVFSVVKAVFIHDSLLR